MRRVCWLRVNPNTVRVDGEIAKIPLKERAPVIVRAIGLSRELLGGAEVVVHYLFYNIMDGAVEITHSEEYDSNWKALVGKPIVCMGDLN
jgi:hypothetical protein